MKLHFEIKKKIKKKGIMSQRRCCVARKTV